MKFSPEAAFFDHCAERKMEKVLHLREKLFKELLKANFWLMAWATSDRILVGNIRIFWNEN